MYFCIYSYIINANIAQIFVTSKAPGIISKIPWNSDQNPLESLSEIWQVSLKSTVFLLINAPGRDAKHNEGASFLTLKQQNTIFSKYVDSHIFFTIFQSLFLMPGIIRI